MPARNPSSTVQPTHSFHAPGFDWEAYTRFRPRYPAAFFERLRDYHAAHADRWDVLHEAGAGGAAVAALTLAERFGEALVSDPDEYHISVAERRVGRAVAGEGDADATDLTRKGGDGRAGKFTFRMAPADQDQSEWLESSSVDVMVMLEAVHHTDPAATVREAARQLRRGGTFCALHYSRPIILSNDAAEGVWSRIMDAWVTFQAGDKPARALVQGDLGVDCVGLSEEEWMDGAVRVRWNWARGREAGRGAAPQSWGMPGRVFDVPAGMVGKGDVVEEVADEGLEGWGVEVDVAWLRGFVASTVPTPPQGWESGLWEELRGLIGDGSVRAVWAVSALFATRR